MPPKRSPAPPASAPPRTFAAVVRGPARVPDDAAVLMAPPSDEEHWTVVGLPREWPCAATPTESAAAYVARVVDVAQSRLAPNDALHASPETLLSATDAGAELLARVATATRMHAVIRALDDALGPETAAAVVLHVAALVPRLDTWRRVQETIRALREPPIELERMDVRVYGRAPHA